MPRHIIAIPDKDFDDLCDHQIIEMIKKDTIPHIYIEECTNYFLAYINKACPPDCNCEFRTEKFKIEKEEIEDFILNFKNIKIVYDMNEEEE